MDTQATSNIQKHTEQLHDDPHKVMKVWRKLGHSALGRALFNLMIGKIVPYSGNIKAKVVAIDNGKVTLEMKDRRAVRNHLKSIHAIALANLGELASGMAMFSKVSNSTRAIVVDLEIKYLKKARGLLTAYGTATPPDVIDSSMTSIVEAEIKDAEGDVVAFVKVHWLLSPPVQANEASNTADSSTNNQIKDVA